MNVQKLYGELIDAGLPVVGVSSDGVVNWGEHEPSTGQEMQAAQVVGAHDPYDFAAERERAYNAREAGAANMALALWNHIVEGESLEVSGVIRVQETRAEVDLEFPETGGMASHG